MQQVVTSGRATTTTSYIGTYEEVSVTGGTTTTTKYYSAGLATVVNVNGTLSYLVADTLGSVSASLTASGGLQAASLYTPYGSVRYTSGIMPTSYGYTKQRQDPSGLNYDHARYYDASVGQFISADSVQGPNRYGYVAGNPETATDPTGNYGEQMCPDGDCREMIADRRAEYQEQHSATTPPPTTQTTPTQPTKPTKPTTPTTNPQSTTVTTGSSNSGASGPVVKNCDVSCQIDNAKNIVFTTKGVFDNDVWGLGAVTAALIALGAVLAAEAVADFASFWLIPLGVTVTALIVQIGEFAAMIGALAVEAGKISGLLGDQYNDKNPADWTQSSLEQLRSSDLSTINSYTSAYQSLLDFWEHNLAGNPATEALAGSTSGGALGSFIDSLNSEVWKQQVSSAFDAEEQAVSTAP